MHDRRGWQKWLVGSAVAAALAASVLIALVVLAPSDQRPAPAEDGQARVVALIGEVGLISSAGNMTPLAEGEQVAPGQIVTTGREDSLVTLEYPDATRVTLGTDTLAQLPGGASAGGANATAKAGQRLFLFKGFVRAEMPAIPSGTPLTLASAHAEVAAAGRQVNVWASSEHTRVESEQGALKLTRRGDRKTVDMQTGSFVIVSAEQREVKPQPLPAATRPRLVLREGTGPVHALAFTADGQTLATGGWKGEVKLWDLRTGELRRAPLQVSKQPIRAGAGSRRQAAGHCGR